MNEYVKLGLFVAVGTLVYAFVFWLISLLPASLEISMILAIILGTLAGVISWGLDA